MDTTCRGRISRGAGTSANGRRRGANLLGLKCVECLIRSRVNGENHSRPRAVTNASIAGMILNCGGN